MAKEIIISENFNKLLSLASKLGLQIKYGNELNYKKSVITLDFYYYFTRNNSKKYLLIGEHQLAHELGHWIISPPQLRKREDYGYPLNARMSGVSRTTAYKRELNEVKAQMVQNELHKFIGIKKFIMASEYVHDLMPWWNKEGKLITDFVIGLTK